MAKEVGEWFRRQLLGDSIAQVVNLILLVFVVYKLLRKPAGDLVSKRQEDVASSLEAAEARLQEAEKKLAEYQARMNSAEEEAKAILERAEQAGKDASQRILEEAAQEAEPDPAAGKRLMLRWNGRRLWQQCGLRSFRPLPKQRISWLEII